MKPEQQIKQILTQMEQLASNIKEIRHNNGQISISSELAGLDIALSNAFKCFEEVKEVNGKYNHTLQAEDLI
jgi:hypothetical protein